MNKNCAQQYLYDSCVFSYILGLVEKQMCLEYPKCEELLMLIEYTDFEHHDDIQRQNEEILERNQQIQDEHVKKTDEYFKKCKIARKITFDIFKYNLDEETGKTVDDYIGQQAQLIFNEKKQQLVEYLQQTKTLGKIVFFSYNMYEQIIQLSKYENSLLRKLMDFHMKKNLKEDELYDRWYDKLSLSFCKVNGKLYLIIQCVQNAFKDLFDLVVNCVDKTEKQQIENIIQSMLNHLQIVCQKYDSQEVSLQYFLFVEEHLQQFIKESNITQQQANNLIIGG